MTFFQKTLVSFATILSFGFYAYISRAEDSQLVATVAPVAFSDPAPQAVSGASAPPQPSAATAATNQTTVAAQAPVVSGEDDGEGEEGGRRAVTTAAPAPAQPAATPAQQQPVAVVQTQPAQQSGQYKNGTYTGPSVDVFYGYVQVQAVIQNGQLADVRFLQYPSDRRTSQSINRQAMPILTQEAVQAQSASVNGVSGASATSQGFVQSLENALSQAHA